MRVFNTESGFEKRIIILYFAIAFFEVIAEIITFKPFLFVLKPLTLIVLMVLYWNSSRQKNLLFIFTIFFLMIVRLYAIETTEKMLFIGMIAYFIHRLLMIYYVNKLIKPVDYFPILIATIPFMFLFFYLLSLTSYITDRSYIGLIIQNILMSLLAGMTLSHYVMNNEKKDVWLLIFGMLSVMQYFIVFIEKFYLLSLSPISFRPLAVLLTTSVNYTFYKFVIETERLNDN